MPRIPVNQPYQITTPFGVPDSNALFGYHSGIDYAGFSAGRPIYAPTSGKLTNIVSATGGNMVVIFDGKYYHRLMHNTSFSRSDGQVNEGDEVAKAGTTGLSTGVHCHWDINTHGNYATAFNQFIDPNIWLNQGGTMSNITTEQVVALSLATTGEQPDPNSDEVVYIGKPLDSAHIDGLITYWASKSRIKELEQAVADRDKKIAALSGEATTLKSGKYIVN